MFIIKVLLKRGCCLSVFSHERVYCIFGVKITSHDYDSHGYIQSHSSVRKTCESTARVLVWFCAELAIAEGYHHKGHICVTSVYTTHVTQGSTEDNAFAANLYKISSFNKSPKIQPRARLLSFVFPLFLYATLLWCQPGSAVIIYP